MTSKNRALLLLLALQTLSLLVYTVFAIQTDGLNLAAVLIDNVKALGWSGQFNLDFACYLMLSGLWIMQRGKFKASAIVAGLAAMVLGIVFFAPYVMYEIIKGKLAIE